MIFYDLFLFLYFLLHLPKFLFGKKRHPNLLQRLGFSLPQQKEKTIWIHAVSVGEVKAAVPFFALLKEEFPNTPIFITTTTATGQEEARRSLPQASFFLYLPFDFSFFVRLFVKKLRPSLFFLIESDVWPQILKEVKKQGGKTFLISGKMSSRSFSRWNLFPLLAKRLFSSIDLLCVQNQEHFARFSPFALGKVHVTGNLKFDMEPHEIPLTPSKHLFLTLSSTHPSEERELLALLKNGPWTLFLAPRHPERFEEVAELLIKEKISFIRIQDFSSLQTEKVVLVDAMGKLSFCYSQSSLALVCGSFVPGIGGHNVLEPCLYGCPVIFGPHTFGQKELVQKVLEAKAGMQVSISQVLPAIQTILHAQKRYSENAFTLVNQLKGASKKTLEIIKLAIKSGT